MELTGESKVLLETILSTMQAMESKLMNEIKSLKEVNEQLQSRCSNLEKTVQHQNETILQLQKRIDSNNIIIHGIDEIDDSSKLEDIVIGIVNEKMNIELKSEEIEEIFRIGQVKGLSPRPIKIRMVNKKSKLNIIKNRSKLKGTKIFINDDLPKILRIREAEKRRQAYEKRSRYNGKRLLPQSSGECEEVESKIIQNAKKINDGNIKYNSEEKQNCPFRAKNLI